VGAGLGVAGGGCPDAADAAEVADAAADAAADADADAADTAEPAATRVPDPTTLVR
jgi:hypothetical protein